MNPPTTTPSAARSRGGLGPTLDTRALVHWLRPRLPHAQEPINMQQIAGGQSNPTWLLRTPERAWVLRSKPGPAATLRPSAHAIEREFRVLQALQGGGVPVPRVHVLCEDESVIGAAFYIMDHVPGRVFRDSFLPDVARDDRAAFHWEANRVLARLHRIDWKALGLQDFGRPNAFFQRLVGRWTGQFRATAGEPIDAMEQLAAWLPRHTPPGADDAGHTRLTHGDFRIENLMFHPTRPEVAAVLDWELSALGHPLSDLAYHCLAWHVPAGVLGGFGDGPLQDQGIPSESKYLRRYCDQVGRNPADVLSDWPFYLACNLFRLGAILVGIGSRVRDGTAAHPNAAAIARMARPVAELGWAIARGHVPALRT
ncbi:MAG TPA: phosphotransferase family protein [Ramlibacter sp.]|nr:phosphotransferase family protein [Ramlibacter sp.]